MRTALGSVASLLVLLAATLLGAGEPPATAAPGPHGDTFHTTTPTRLLDTRTDGYRDVVTPGSTRSVAVARRAGVPADATAVVLNVTAADASSAGYLTTWASGAARPATSTLTYARGRTVANLAVVQLGDGGALDLYNGSAGTVQVILDVTGYYTSTADGSSGGTVPVTPTRLLDTRRTGPALAPGRTSAVRVAGRAGVPSTGASAVIVNLTTTRASRPGYVTTWANGTRRPGTTSVNVVPGETTSTLALVPLGTDGAIATYDGSTGPVDLVVDVVAYVGAGDGSAGAADGTIVPITPARLLDTRSARGGARPAAQASVRLPVRDVAPATPLRVGAVVLEVTATRAAAPGYVTAYDGSTLPETSTLNLVPGRTVSNLAVVPVGCDGRIALRNGSSRPVDLVADAVGYVSTTHQPCWHDVSRGLPQGGDAQATSCLPDGSCMVLGWTSRDGDRTRWSAWRHADGSYGPVTAVPGRAAPGPVTGVSCTSSTSCVAVADGDGLFHDQFHDGQAEALSFDGTQWTRTVLPKPTNRDNVDSDSSPAGVSCVSSTHCVAAGTYGAYTTAWTLDQGAWTATVPSYGQATHRVYGVSCTGTDYCVVLGGSGSSATFYTLDGDTWTYRELSGGNSDRLRGLSCLSSSECYAVGYYAAAELVAGEWALVDEPDDTLVTESCVSGGSCVAVGYGRAVTRSPSDWHDGQSLAPLRPADDPRLVSVSCGSVGHCLAVGTAGPAPWAEAYE